MNQRFQWPNTALRGLSPESRGGFKHSLFGLLLNARSHGARRAKEVATAQAVGLREYTIEPRTGLRFNRSQTQCLRTGLHSHAPTELYRIWTHSDS